MLYGSETSFNLLGSSVRFYTVLQTFLLKTQRFILSFSLVFHAAMLVMACIQIQQTEIALVRNPGGSCDGDGYAVSIRTTL